LLKIELQKTDFQERLIFEYEDHYSVLALDQQLNIEIKMKVVVIANAEVKHVVHLGMF
jgi:hypothetical protein